MSNEPIEPIDPPTTLWAQPYLWEIACRHLMESSEIQCSIAFIAMEGCVRTQVQRDYEDHLKELETHLEIQHRGEMELLRWEVEKGFKILSVNLGCCHWWAKFWFFSSNFLAEYFFLSASSVAFSNGRHPLSRPHPFIGSFNGHCLSMHLQKWKLDALHLLVTSCVCPFLNIHAVIHSFKLCPPW